ncbi:hypothetical protein B0T19DRAFT_243500 [Cercophora scortea]|uniref:Uncharacterized protein n=1 Tax=Cercophora scortea TaxID=314031 RepID=A0AAE0M6Q6_9PEZI|nr:hypothetical protein B0T19DRAFT_243500 [Cercophora scortea]
MSWYKCNRNLVVVVLNSSSNSIMWETSLTQPTESATIYQVLPENSGIPPVLLALFPLQSSSPDRTRPGERSSDEKLEQRTLTTTMPLKTSSFSKSGVDRRLIPDRAHSVARGPSYPSVQHGLPDATLLSTSGRHRAVVAISVAIGCARWVLIVWALDATSSGPVACVL